MQIAQDQPRASLYKNIPFSVLNPPPPCPPTGARTNTDKRESTQFCACERIERWVLRVRISRTDGVRRTHGTDSSTTVRTVQVVDHVNFRPWLRMFYLGLLCSGGVAVVIRSST